MRKPPIPVKSSIGFAAFLSVVLAGCASTQEVLEPSALQSLQAESEASSTLDAPDPGEQDHERATLAQAEDQPPATQQVAAAPLRLHFAPVIGATTQASAPLSARLNARAGERGLSLVSADNQTFTHSLKGYFSTISEDGGTSVIFVWDVIDRNGNRVHRIQGQQSAEGAGEDGWSSVDSATMEAIADRTLDQLTIWAGSRAG